jgi:hypothetical protein
VSGSTKSGKTIFVKKRYVNVMIDKPPENIAYFYAKYQDTFGEIQNLVPGIKFVQGLPDDILDSLIPKHAIYMSLMISWVRRTELFQNYSRKNHIMVTYLSVIYIVHR